MTEVEVPKENIPPADADQEDIVTPWDVEGKIIILI